MVVMRITDMKRVASGFVVQVQWSAYKNDGEAQAETSGVVTFEKEKDDFVPFGELTESLVLSWIKDKVDMVKIEKDLDNQLAELNAQPYSEVPWSRIREE